MKKTFHFAHLVSTSFLMFGILACTAFSHVAWCAKAKLSTAPIHLSCDSLHNPLGIDVTNPRLSWQMPAVKRGIHQTAYEILVTTMPELPAGTIPA